MNWHRSESLTVRLHPSCVGARIRDATTLALRQQVLGTPLPKLGYVVGIQPHLPSICLRMSDDNRWATVKVVCELLTLNPREGVCMWCQPLTMDDAGVMCAYGKLTVFCPEGLSDSLAMHAVRRGHRGRVLVKIAHIQYEQESMVIVGELITCG